MKIDRRQFGMGGMATLIAFSGAKASARPVGVAGSRPWHLRVKRMMQVNFVERDALNFDTKAWIDYLVSTRADCTMLSVTNMVAFFPSAIPDLPRSRWLDGRDIVGECARAAKAAGIRVVGRFSPDVASKKLAESHPDWFRRDAQGNLVVATTSFSKSDGTDPSASLDFARTCPFSGYYSEFLPQLMDEVMSRYGIDGIYANGWPGNDIPRCYCVACRKIGDPKSEIYKAAYQKRTAELWALYNQTVTRRNREAIFSGNLGNGMRSGELDIKPLMAQAVWMFADNQGRTDADSPSWECSQQTRIAVALGGSDRPAVISTAAWAFVGPTAWRTVTGNPSEVRSRLFQTLAAGGTMHLHWLGFDQGFREDRRWQPIGQDVLAWQSRNDQHFHNLRSIADVAMVASARSNLYRSPVGTGGLDSFHGMYKLLTESRVPFDVVLDSDLSMATIGRYKVLILPNVAVMDDRQASQIRAFAGAGGSVMATFETGLYDPAGQLRNDFLLADVFGVHKSGPREGFGSDGARRLPGATTMQRIERPHPILDGFKDTNWIEGSSWRVPITAEGPVILSNIPQHAVYPVEAVFATRSHTDEPTLVAREVGNSRAVYLSGDIEAGYWRTSAADLGNLLGGAISWLTRGGHPVRVAGEGLVEVFGWRTEPGYAVHLVNHTNPNFRSGALQKAFPVGPQTVSLDLESEATIKSARLLRANTPVAFTQVGRRVEATVPSVAEYEVLAFTT